MTDYNVNPVRDDLLLLRREYLKLCADIRAQVSKIDDIVYEFNAAENRSEWPEIIAQIDRLKRIDTYRAEKQYDEVRFYLEPVDR